MATDKEEVSFILGAVVAVALFVVVIFMTNPASQRDWQQAVVDNNCGQYNTTTGDFEWLPKEVENGKD